MRPEDGVNFLLSILRDSSAGMTSKDLEEAIRLAGQYSPSAVFKRASSYWQLCHGSAGSLYLGYAKGTRWLSVIRRDEGVRAFETAAAKLVFGGDPLVGAANFAREAHDGQTREGGEPYYHHVFRVAYALHRLDSHKLSRIAAALLHDTVEDCEVTARQIKAQFGDSVARTVVALTHLDENEPEVVHLARVAEGGLDAILVKRYDRIDNIQSLVEAPAEFRRQKLEEVRDNFLPLWRKIDPEGIELIEAELAAYI